jgi:tetratricopeptide (TPR) repeat protein
MKKIKYIILVILTFVLYGNTLFHDFALDDTMVITANEYTLSGLDGVDDIFTEDFFSGLFERKDNNLVAGGRYRPLSIAIFALEWDLIVGTPFDGIDKAALEAKMNKNANPKIISPSQKLLKDLAVTIHVENKKIRTKDQQRLLRNNAYLTKEEKNIISDNLEQMHNRRGLFLFIAHFINVLLYAFTGIVLLKILEYLFKRFNAKQWYLSIPFLATVLFIVHPIHTEVVANIKGLDEILSLLGSLLAMWYVLKYLENKKTFHIVLSFVFFTAAMFSKEVAITFIAIIPLSIYFFADCNKKGKQIIITSVPFIIGAAIYLYIRQVVVGAVTFESNPELMNNSFLGMDFMEKYATIFYTLLLYIKLLVFPHPLTYDYYPYHIPAMQWTDIWPIVGLLIYVAIGIYALFGIKRKRVISYGILVYLIALSPTSNVLFPIGVFMSERFLYVASIGFVIIVAWFINYILTKEVLKQRNLEIALVGIFVLLSIKTVSRNSVWKNDFTLFTNDVEISKNSAKSNTSAGGLLMEEAIKPKNKEIKKEYLDRSIKYLHRAVKIHPKYVDALILLGNAKWERYESVDSAFKYYELVLKRYPKFDKVYINLFDSEIKFEFEKGERTDQNLEILNTVKKYDPENYKVNYYLGRIYGRFRNDLETSKHYFEKALSIDSSQVEIYKDLGEVYGMSKEFDKSAEALTRAIRLDPKDPALKMNLAMTYLQIGKNKEALQVMDEALNMNYTSKNAANLITLGKLYESFNMPEKTKDCFVKAQKLNPELFQQ